MVVMETNVSRPDDRRTRRSRTQLVLIFALFLLPPVSAWVAWKYLGEQGVGRDHQCRNPGFSGAAAATGRARPADGTALAEEELRGRWTYVLFAPGDCDERCQQQLYLTRQIRLAMSKDIPRVQRLLVLAQQPAAELESRLADEQPDLRWVVRGEQADPLLQQFRGDGFCPTGEQYFLVDPLGNLMMYYNLEVPAKGMMRDLQKLLKISQIG